MPAPGAAAGQDVRGARGARHRPWKDPKAIADGPSILAYIRETAAAHGIADRIRFGHRVVRASWSSASARWTVSTAHWPASLDHPSKRVVVIGSGATAVTLVPALASRAAHVTMLQRSPSYLAARPGSDALSDRIRALLPGKLAHRVVRGKNVVMGTLFFQLMRRLPERSSPVDPHFVPSYAPWDQRLCLVPDADLLKALRSGKADIVTDGIARFTASGVELTSGRTVPADLIVTATGLRLVAFGGIELAVDGRAISTGDQRA